MLVQIGRLFHDPSHMEQCLRRYATDVQANPPEPRVTIDENHFLAEIGRSKGGCVASWAATEHEDVCDFIHASSLHPVLEQEATQVR